MTGLPKELELLAAAREAFDSAYAPYSGFRVGAAVLDDEGRIFSGCNVENASYGGTVCAERNAIGAAVRAGARRIVACVVHTKHTRATPPCGICRQVLREFGDDMIVVSVTDSGQAAHWSLDALLPDAFGPDDLA